MFVLKMQLQLWLYWFNWNLVMLQLFKVAEFSVAGGQW